MTQNTMPLIIGILNTTPDSFHDGGQFNSVQKAREHAKEFIDEGADIIDIGGESTGPGSADVSLEEELQRVIPIIEAIHASFPDVRISVDTYKAAVARAAVDAGASMINDITAGRGDSEMLGTIAALGVDYVMMYSKDSSARTTKNSLEYDDVVKTVKEFLSRRIDAAIAAGIAKEKIILDPGLGHFISSIPKYSFEILERLSEFQDLGCPLYISPSRKSFLAGPENLPPEERLEATVAASALGVRNGAMYVRTHDVAPVREGLFA